ncbi:helix-turn-helix domain-containing protein [Dyella japonica]|uniref:Transcriptional regulator with XRE-family HTH domain n=1 Tax=Dyella japonica TaxID=231455 RepID=A0ABV2JS84_9GAMM
MSNSDRLLDIYMQKLSLRTLSEVASKLNVTRPAVSNWRAGTSHPNAEAIETMCKATGEPLSRWLPLIEAERCRTEGDRKVWLRLAQAAAAIAAAFLILRHGVDTHAVSAFVFAPAIHYAKL